MAGNTTCLGVVNLDSRDGTNLCSLNVEEAAHKLVSGYCAAFVQNLLDVMSRGVQDGESKHGVRQLPVQPEVLVEREEAKLRSDPSHNRSADRE